MAPILQMRKQRHKVEQGPGGARKPPALTTEAGSGGAASSAVGEAWVGAPRAELTGHASHRPQPT